MQISGLAWWKEGDISFEFMITWLELVVPLGDNVCMFGKCENSAKMFPGPDIHVIFCNLE